MDDLFGLPELLIISLGQRAECLVQISGRKKAPMPISLSIIIMRSTARFYGVPGPSSGRRSGGAGNRLRRGFRCRGSETARFSRNSPIILRGYPGSDGLSGGTCYE